MRAITCRPRTWAFTAALLSVAGVSLGDTVYSESEVAADFGQSSQNATDTGLPFGAYLIPATSGVFGAQKGPVACAPTATVNSFQFLQNTGPVTGLVGANPFDAINSLASSTYMNTQDETPNPNPPPAPPYVGGGTSADNLVLGKEQYIKDKARTPGGTYIQTVGQSVFFSQASNGMDLGGIAQTAPTAAFIAQQLMDGEDIEAAITWTDANGVPVGGGHIITLTGINYNATTNMGTISMIDPFGGSAPNSAVDITSDSLKLIGGRLVLGYSGGGAGNDGDPDNNVSSSFARLDVVVAESLVPEPGTLSLLVLGAIMISRRRRSSTPI